MIKINIPVGGKSFIGDLNEPVDISIPIRREQSLNAFYLPHPEFSTVHEGGFIGDVNQGGSCNVENILISPHGNGTHTECAGHISKEKITIGSVVSNFHFPCSLVTVTIENNSRGEVLSKTQLEKAIRNLPEGTEALVIRSLPNSAEKKDRNYSGKKPPYFPAEGIPLILEKNIRHLLVDLPSLDHEEDPDLQAHHAFFEYPEKKNSKRTITELIFIPSIIKDGLYLLNLQVLNLESDASPSRPVLFELHEEK